MIINNIDVEDITPWPEIDKAYESITGESSNSKTLTDMIEWVEAHPDLFVIEPITHSIHRIIKSKVSVPMDDFIHALTTHINSTKEAHYTNKDKSDLMGFFQTTELFEGFCIGNVMKYVYRFRKTKNLKDLLKATHYISFLYDKEIKKKDNV